MCTKYNLNDNPDVFRCFIPRNLSKTNMAEELTNNFTWIITPCLKKHHENDNKYTNDISETHISLRRSSRKDCYKVTPPKELDSKQCNGPYLDIPGIIRWNGTNNTNNIQREVSPECDIFNGLRSRSMNHKEINRKHVRFADDLGLKLSCVRIIKTKDAQKAPILSTSATKNLNLDHNPHLAMQGIKYFTKIHDIISDIEKIYQRVNTQNICLEDASINGNTLYGRIIVKNLSYEKNVGIRITFDNWSTYKDIFGSYILDSSKNGMDKFSFSVTLPHLILVDTKIQFTPFYWAQNGYTYWDNNDGRNYSFECYAKIMGIVNENGWMHFL